MAVDVCDPATLLDHTLGWCASTQLSLEFRAALPLEDEHVALLSSLRRDRPRARIDVMLRFSTLWIALALVVGARNPIAPRASSDAVRVEYTSTSQGLRYFDGGEPFEHDRILCEVSEVDRGLEVRFEAMRDYGIDTKITLIRTDEGGTRAEVSAVRRLPASSGHGTDITEVGDLHGVVQLLMPDWSPGHDVDLEFDVEGTLEGAPVKLFGGWAVRNGTKSAGLARALPAVRETSLSGIHWPSAGEVRRAGMPEKWSPNPLLFWSAGAMSLSFDATDRLAGPELDTCLVGRGIDVFEPGVLEFDVCDARRCDGRFARIELPVESGRVFAVFALKPGVSPTCRWIVWGEHVGQHVYDCDVPIWARPSTSDQPEVGPLSVLPRWFPAQSAYTEVRRTVLPGGRDDGRRVLQVLDWVPRPPLLRRQILGDPLNVSYEQIAGPLASWTEPEWFVRMRWNPRAK